MKNTKLYYQIHQYRLDYILKQIESLKISDKSFVLDVGCYPPYLFNSLKHKYQTYGISSPQEPINSKNIFILDIEHDKIKIKQKFDLIVFTEILEHLTNPVPVLNTLSSLLKPNGFLLITTPNVNRWHNLFLQLLGRNIYFPLFQLSQPINFRHQREYTLTEITSLTSLKPIILKYFIGYPPYRQKNNRDDLFLKIVKYKLYFIELLFPNRRDSLLAIFQK